MYDGRWRARIVYDTPLPNRSEGSSGEGKKQRPLLCDVSSAPGRRILRPFVRRVHGKHQRTGLRGEMASSMVRATVRAVSKRKIQATRAALTLVSTRGAAAGSRLPRFLPSRGADGGRGFSLYGRLVNKPLCAGAASCVVVVVPLLQLSAKCGFVGRPFLLPPRTLLGYGLRRAAEAGTPQKEAPWLSCSVCSLPCCFPVGCETLRLASLWLSCLATSKALPRTQKEQKTNAAHLPSTNPYLLQQGDKLFAELFWLPRFARCLFKGAF